MGWLVVLLAAACRCPQPPLSRFPSAAQALERMRATYACSRAVQGDAAIEYFGSEGRIRGKVMYLAALPEALRFDIYSPFGAILSTLTSDGRDFSLLDVKRKEFLQGPATTCNVARLTRVPVPPSALVELLRGEAPVLAHDPAALELSWACDRYRLKIPGRHDAVQTIELVPRPTDRDRPWYEQQVRVLTVEVVQAGAPLYRAELRDHQPTLRAKVESFPDDLGGAVSPSGPACDAEVPRALRLTVPHTEQVLTLRNHEVFHNPPLDPDGFRQTPPGGIRRVHATCDSPE
jgi:hypothetical protein